MRRRSIAAFVFLATMASRHARADDARCIAAFESTQRLRKEGKLRAAREEALACSATSCPEIAARECTTWVLEIDAAMPTAVFAANSGDKELVDVEVFVDGASVSQRLDGRARSIEPGAHRVRFVSPGHDAAEIDAVFAEGEKNRKISVSLRAHAPPIVPVETRARPVPLVTWLLAGASAVSFGGAAIFGVDGLRRKSDLDALGCKPACDDGATSATERAFVVADVLSVVGIGLAAAAVLTYVTLDAHR